MGGKQRPRAGFLDRMTKVRGRPRWRSPDGMAFYEWDSLHGEVEWYDRCGYHAGVLDAVTGEQIKPAVRGRKINV